MTSLAGAHRGGRQCIIVGKIISCGWPDLAILSSYGNLKHSGRHTANTDLWEVEGRQKE